MWKKIRKYVYTLFVLLGLIILSGSIFVFCFFGNIKEMSVLEQLFSSDEQLWGKGLIRSYKFTKLLDAIDNEDKKEINYLIDQKKYDLNELKIKGRYFTTSLLRLYIIEKGNEANPDFIRYLISKGFDADECEQGFSSPIYAAALVGNIEVAKILLENGAKVNCPYKDKGLPLTAALMMKQCDFVKYLVTKGASLDSLTCDEKTKRDIQKKLDDCYK